VLTAADLPDDPEVLRALLVAAMTEKAQLTAKSAHLAAEVERMGAEVARKTVATTEAEAEIARLNAIIAAFMRHRFGPRSEKLIEDQLELVLLIPVHSAPLFRDDAAPLFRNLVAP
jgi:transposase